MKTKEKKCVMRLVVAYKTITTLYLLSLTGNHKGGLAVGKALASGYNIAAEVVEYLQTSGGQKLYTMALTNV